MFTPSICGRKSFPARQHMATTSAPRRCLSYPGYFDVSHFRKAVMLSISNERVSSVASFSSGRHCNTLIVGSAFPPSLKHCSNIPPREVTREAPSVWLGGDGPADKPFQAGIASRPAGRASRLASQPDGWPSHARQPGQAMSTSQASPAVGWGKQTKMGVEREPLCV